MLHLKCAVSPVGIFLTNALRSHHLCGLECSGLIYLKYEPPNRRLLSVSNVDVRLRLKMVL